MVFKISLEQAIARYLLDSENEGNTPSSLKKKRKFFNRLLKYGRDKELSEQLIQDFLQALRERTFKGNKLSPGSIRTYGIMLRAFCNWALENHYHDGLEHKIIVPQEKQKELHLLSLKKTYQVIDLGTTPGQYDNKKTTRIKLDEVRPALYLALGTGLRISELLSIKGEDLILDDEAPKVKIRSKGGNIDYAGLPKDMINFLKTRATRSRIFDISEEVLRVSLARGCQQLGVHKIGVHDLRHTFTTNLLRRGMPLQQVSRLLRHKHVAVTDKYYSHYDIDELVIQMKLHGLKPLVSSFMQAKLDRAPVRLGI